MNVLNFIHLATNKEFFRKRPIICFTGTSYPLLFFALLRQRIGNLMQGCIKSINLHDNELETIKAQVSMPFLGSMLIYWLGTIDTLDAKKKKEFLSYIKSYIGPHSLCFFSEHIDEVNHNKAFNLIELSSTVDQKQFIALYTYFFPLVKTENVSMCSALFKQHNSLSLDTACLLMHYCSVMSRSQVGIFIKEWFDKILVPEKSLFSLSTSLFAKNSEAFFRLWHQVSQDYPTQFWVSFWSDQLFRATCFVKFARAQKFVPAKKIAYRLPFSFIKKDWHNYTSTELTEAHHVLYRLDCTIKNGGADVWLDIFYQRFFTMH
jgi:hypothetical protein